MNNTKYYFVKYTEMYDGRERIQSLLSNTTDSRLIVNKEYGVDPNELDQDDPI